MKILYLLFSFTTGGTERLVTDICGEMVSRGHDVHLYIVNDLYDASMLEGLPPAVRVERQNRPVGGGGKLATVWKIARYIRRHKIDVVHGNSVNVPELLILHPLLFPRTRIVQTIHAIHSYGGSPAQRRLCNGLCDRLIAISRSVREDMIQRGAPADKISLVYNAMDLTRFHPTERQTPHTPVCIANVARLVPETKGQDVLLEAMVILRKTHPQVRCLLAGAGDKAHEAAVQELRQFVADNSLQDTVTFLGNVPDVPAFLQQVDIFVLPSRFEGFGISLIEAMAMGIPCAASNLDGPAELIGGRQEYGRLFPCGDAAALAAALSDMIDDYAAEKQRARRAQAYVREHFAMPAMAERLLQIYSGGR